jgi:pimeloyl-ACP methyl ester carboxylesterase
MAMSTSYLRRGEGRIAYDVQGSGPLVVCLHGMGDLRGTYRFTVPALVAAGYRVATMDLRGHGDSDTTFSAYDDVAAGTDALALIEHLGGPALLVGNSMGAAASVWAAAEDPTKIAGLVLIGPVVRNPSGNPLMALAYRLLLARPWGPALWRAYYKRANPVRPSDLDEHIARISASLARPGRWQAFTRTTRTSHAPAEARLPRVHAPTLVVMGTKDPDWPDPTAEARSLADTLHGELLLVPGAGHYPMAENPDLVNPALVAFAATAHARA